MISKERLEKGLYWTKAYKLVEGCTHISTGCDNCWSESETAMRSQHPNEKIWLRTAGVLGSHFKFNGRVLLREDNLDLPLRTKKPTVFAVWNDLYHEGVPDEFRDRAYAVMALCPQHTFLVLTKRAQRMEEYWSDLESVVGRQMEIALEMQGKKTVALALGHVWHIVTAENQQTANERIRHLLRVPGKRGVSIEPMLGLVDLSHMTVGGAASIYRANALTGDGFDGQGIHAVLLGGESGKNARPMHPDWVRSVRDQCALSGVSFYFKQWGEWLPFQVATCMDGINLRGEIVNLTSPLRADDDSPGSIEMIRVGKRAAGRLLDGHTYDNLPWDKEQTCKQDS